MQPVNRVRAGAVPPALAQRPGKGVRNAEAERGLHRAAAELAASPPGAMSKGTCPCLARKEGQVRFRPGRG
jgi:hypothetical protein